MIIFGKNAVLEALESKTAVNKVIVSNALSGSLLQNIEYLCKKKNIKVLKLSREEFKKAYPEHAQGMAAEVQDFKYTELDELLNKKDVFLVLLDGVEDPHNLGAIIRVAECAGATGVIIPKNRAVQVTETVARVSAGALSHMAVAQVNNIHDAIDKIKNSGTFVYAADMDGEIMYNTNLEGNIAIVIGGEGKGVSSLSRKKADGIIKIPMFGKVNSLNASVSAGIVLYEVVRQRSGQ